MSSAIRPARLRGTAALAALGFTLGVGAPMLASAQGQPKPPAQTQKPAAQPAQPAQPAGAQPQAAPASAGPTIVQVKPEPSQTDWTKVCGKDPNQNMEVCYTTRDFVSDQGQPVLAAAIYDVKGAQNQKIVRFLMPLGLMLRPGIRFAVDQGAQTPGQYAVCLPNGCFAEAVVKDDQVAAMKKGTNLNISVQNQGAREVTFAVPLAGFGKSFDGPAIDPKELEEQQKKLQAELEKRSDELRKRLEQGQTTNSTAPAANAAKP